MNLRQTPYAQIALICLRGLNLQDSRWLYFTLICCALLVLAGGGIAIEWGVVALIKTVIGATAFALQIAWVGISAVLMRLNHPITSRLVPGYVGALRRTALAIWLSICVLTGIVGLLDVSSLGEFVFGVCLAGAVMLLTSTPLRWPVKWVLFLVFLAWFGRHSVEITAWEPIHAMVMSRLGRLAFAAVVFASMAWVVTRMIATEGSAYASLFSKFLAMQQAERVVDKPDALDVGNFGSWGNAYTRAAHWAKLPWQRYASYILTTHPAGPANAVARAELGFGPVVHWVTQASASVGFAGLVAVGWWINRNFMAQDDARISSLTALNIALVGAACAATSVLYIADAMLHTQGEQKLMLLLPGVPQGNALSQSLAARHLRQAFAAWLLAVAWALVLPYPDGAANYVIAFCWGTLPLVPFVIQDWAALRPPQALRGIVLLVLAMLVPVSAWAALQWLHMPVWLLAAIAVGSCLAVLRLRWNRLAQFPQALPVGRLA